MFSQRTRSPGSCTDSLDVPRIPKSRINTKTVSQIHLHISKRSPHPPTPRRATPGSPWQLPAAGACLLQGALPIAEPGEVAARCPPAPVCCKAPCPSRNPARWPPGARRREQVVQAVRCASASPAAAPLEPPSHLLYPDRIPVDHGYG
jgi:hypothetical protein